MNKLVVATSNPAKLKQYIDAINRSGLDVEALSLRNFDIHEKPVESGETAEENARIKAAFYVKILGIPVMAEDAALFVDFFSEGTQPNVNVRRVNGLRESTDEEVLAYWQKAVSQTPSDKRTGRWRIAHAIALPDGNIRSISHNEEIRFYDPPSLVRIPGWPTSSLQGRVDFGKPDVELSEEKRVQKENDRINPAIPLIKEVLGFASSKSKSHNQKE